MKEITIDIPSFEEKNIFFAIRNKIDYLLLIVNTARLLLLGNIVNDNVTSPVGSIKIVVDKMSRLFLFQKNKKVSVHFPFTIEMDASGTQVESLYLKSGTVIDNLKIAAIMAVLLSESFKLYSSVLNHFVIEKDIDEEGLEALEELLICEPSYVRFDIDSENENGRIHPLNHIDVNSSSNGTYKLGLYSSLNNEEFIDLTNIKTNCKHFEN